MSGDDRTAGMPSEEAPSIEGSFADLLERVRAGSQDAWRTLVARYKRGMLHVIGCFIAPRHALWRRMDPADIMQEVWKSVFEALVAGTAFPDEHRFVAFLKTVTRDRAHLQMRLHVARKKRSIGREERSSAGCDICSKESGPGESAAASDLLEKWLDGSASLDERAVLVWSLRGYTAQELADNMQMNIRTVRRVVQRARVRWLTLCAGGGVTVPIW
jgi:RNA polymerase sigma factor (sigma-70 family)